MKISVCLIVKDEEKVIERCLNCVTDFADEIIVVDTGSHDETKNMVKKFTDKVYDFIWNDDFSAARNYAFSKATCDYLFWVDADDVITKENTDKIIKLKNENKTSDTYMFRYATAFDKHGNITFEYYRERLIRNCPYAIFKGFIHESVAPFGDIRYTDITVEHRKISSGDPTRNLRIYETRLSYGYTLNKRDEYYYAKELFYNGKYSQAKKALLKFVSCGKAYLPDVRDAYKTIYKCDILRKLKADEKNLTDALCRVGADAEIFCYLGDIRAEREDFVNAVAFYKCALCADLPSPKDGFYERKFYYLEPLLRLVSLYYKLGDKRTAAVYHEMCVKSYPSADETIYNSQFFANKK